MKIENKDAYPLNQDINLNDYIIGTRESDGKTLNFSIADLVSIILQSLTGGGAKGWVYSEVLSNGNVIQSDALKQAVSVDLIISNGVVIKNPLPPENFDSPSGTITGYPVFEGEKHLIFFTKP